MLGMIKLRNYSLYLCFPNEHLWFLFADYIDAAKLFDIVTAG